MPVRSPASAKARLSGRPTWPAPPRTTTSRSFPITLAGEPRSVGGGAGDRLGQSLARRLGEARPDEPFRGAAEPGLERDLGRPAKHPPGLLDVHHAATDVVDVAAVDVAQLDVDAEGSTDREPELVHRRLDPGADVEGLALGPWTDRREEGGLDGVVDVRVVAGLLAVAVDGQRPAGLGVDEELRDDAAVRVVRALAGSVDVAVADARGRD